jgi:hypothetical protein
MGAKHWAEPSAALSDVASGSEVLTREQVASWRERGFALVNGVIPEPVVQKLREDAREIFPPAGSPESTQVTDFGSMGKLEFPAESEPMNELTLHPRLLRALAQLLAVDTKQLRLTQSDVWPKYGRSSRSGSQWDNDDQRMHVDYPNHTLTHPPSWDAPEAVELILYLSDVEHSGGATALVPRSGPDDPAYAWPIVNTPGVAGIEWINDRECAEAHLEREAPEVARWRREHLYPRELHARFRTGSLLLYRHDTWHRGTPLRPGSMRLAQNMTFRKAGSEWISVLHPGWSWAMYRRSRVMERLIASATVEQRCVLGFPAPGHAYWTAQTIGAVGARFGAHGIDMTPYEEALEA